MKKHKKTGFRQSVAACLAEALQDYFADLAGEPGAKLHETALAVVDEELLKIVLPMHDGNISAAAKTLGISRTTLIRKMSAYGLHAHKKRAR